jgi:hypothetical protein
MRFRVARLGSEFLPVRPLRIGSLPTAWTQEIGPLVYPNLIASRAIYCCWAVGIIFEPIVDSQMKIDGLDEGTNASLWVEQGK